MGGGVRARKTRRAKTVKITGKRQVQKVHKAKGSQKNPLTNLMDDKLSIAKAYARMGLKDSADRSAEEVKQIAEAIPAEKKATLPEPVQPGPSLKYVSELEYAFVDTLVEKHGLDYEAMSRDHKNNPFQYTAGQLRKRVMKVIKLEQALFPEVYKEMFGDELPVA
eukprot:Sspe_Gene.75949::Locus_47447_Transcript_2_2_Confidence_0.667_Length_711::g.75949::m.75949